MADNNSHSSYTHKGKEVPRVSSIIKLLAKDSLMLWANSLGFRRQKYQEVIDLEARIGTMIHAYGENYNTGKKKLEKLDFKGNNIHNEMDKYKVINGCTSYMKFRMKNPDFKIKHKELTLTNSDMGGTIDIVAESIFNKDHVIICDIKTSKTYYISMFLQLVAYVILYEHNFPNETVDGILVILTDKTTGDKAKTRFYARKDLGPFIELFCSLLKVHQNLRIVESIAYDDTIYN